MKRIFVTLAIVLSFVGVAVSTVPAQASSPRPKPGTVQAGGRTISYYTPAQLAKLGGTTKVVSHTTATMTLRQTGVSPDFVVGAGHTGTLDVFLQVFLLQGVPLCVYGLDVTNTNAPAPYEIDTTADIYRNGIFLQQLSGAAYNVQTYTLESNCFFSLTGLYENTAYTQAIWGDSTGTATVTDYLAL